MVNTSLTRKILSFLILLLFFSPAFSATYYVKSSGSDDFGDGSLQSPWKTPEFGAKQLKSPGDTLVIHTGIYHLNAANLPPNEAEMHRARALVSPPNGVSGTPDNPIIIKSAGDGPVLLDAGSSPEWPAIGTNSGDYLVIDGFQIRGAVILWSTTGSIVQNSDIFGGGDTPLKNGGDGFGAVLRVEDTRDCIIRNNKLHDNQLGISQGNSPLLIEYDSTNLIIEYNDFYRSVGTAVYLKDDPETVHVRNNFFYNNSTAAIESANQDDGNNIFIYNNLFLFNNTSDNKDYGAVTTVIEADNWKIYNNTFYGNKVADIWLKYADINNVEIWNNIHAQSALYLKAGYIQSGANLSDVVTYSNFNHYDGAAKWMDRGRAYNTLSEFSSTTGFDSQSTVKNPEFINPGGREATDYKRLTYPKDGRSGDFSETIGAYQGSDTRIGSNLGPKSPHSINIK